MNRGVPNALARARPDVAASNVVLLPSARIMRVTVPPPARSRDVIWEALLLGIVALELHVLAFFWYQGAADTPTPPKPLPIEITFVAPPPPPAPPLPPKVEAPAPLPPVASPPKLEVPKPKPKPIAKPKPAPQPAPVPEDAIPLQTVPVPPAPPAPATPAAETAPPAPESVTEAHSDERIGNPKPEYPSIARRRGWEGKALVKVHVLENGRADSVELASTSGHDVLDRSALTTVATWRFVPAARGKIPIASWVTIAVTFKLEN